METDGQVTGARRPAHGSNLGWEITVEPSGNNAVTLVLPVETDCEAQGAICTGDARKLSKPMPATVAGPGRTGWAEGSARSRSTQFGNL